MKIEYDKRGYSVLENGPIYYTKDMDRTIEWFENVLGWYGTVDARDDQGKGIFGGIAPIPDEITKKEKLTYLGFSLLRGEPTDRVVAYFVADDARACFDFMKKSNWDKHTELISQPWGGIEFVVTTIDGSLIRIASY